MLFKKKENVKIELVDEDEIVKLVIDYFNKSDKEVFRKELLHHLLGDTNPFLVMVDTNFFSKMEEEHETQWVKNFREWLEDDVLTHQVMKVKKDRPTGVLGTLFSGNKSKKDFFAYRVGVYMDAKEFETLVGYHDQVKMGIHLGINIKHEDVDFLLREYCAGLIDEDNRFRFYELDLYDYCEVGRMVIHSESFDQIAALKAQIHAYLGE